MTEAVEDLGPLPYASKVEAMAGYGLSPADIARVLDIDVEELKASYEKELGQRPHQGQRQGGREPLPQGHRRRPRNRHRRDLLAEDPGALEGDDRQRGHARRRRSALGAHAAHRRAGPQAP